jgi:tyrosine-protein kinase Etk/Wzc
VPADLPSAWLISPAEVPNKKSAPRRAVLGVAALAFSGLLGGGAALLRETGRSAVKRRARQLVRQLDLRWLILIPRIPSSGIRRRRLPTLLRWLSSARARPCGRAIHRLAAELLSIATGSTGLRRVIWFTSAAPGAGVTTVATSAAAAVAGYGRRVLLIDASVEDPRLHELAEEAGTDLLTILAETGRDPAGALRAPSDAGLPTVLPFGSRRDVLVERNRLQDVLEELLAVFDIVIVDGGAQGVGPSAIPTPQDSSVVLVVPCRGSEVEDVADLQYRLANARSRVVGAVLTRCPARSLPG